MVSRRAAVAVRVAFSFVVNARATVGDGPQGRLLRRLFRVDYPPAVLLGAYVPYAVGPRVFRYEVAYNRFFRLVIYGLRGATRHGAVFFEFCAMAVVQVTPVRR